MPNSSYHRQAWKLYERVLMYRSSLAQLAAFSYFFLFFIIGKEASQISEEYIESGKSVNQEVQRDLLPYGRYSTYAFMLGRLILMLISLKKLEICRVYLYYEALNVIIHNLMATEGTADDANFRHIIMQILNFLLYYFDWWPSFIVSLLTVIA